MYSSYQPPRTQCCPNCQHTFPTKLGVTAEDIERRKEAIFAMDFTENCTIETETSSTAQPTHRPIRFPRLRRWWSLLIKC